MQNNISEAGEDFVLRCWECPVMTSLAVVGGKWKPAILYALTLRPVMRFGALRRAIEGITQKMLTQQLRELERDGIVSRTVYAEVPPRVEYTLTEHGRTIQPLMHTMAEWGRLHLSHSPQKP